MARKSRKTKKAQTAPPIFAAPVYNTAIYVRLSVMDSREPDEQGRLAGAVSPQAKFRGGNEGESILNQQELLKNYIAERPELILKEVFVDNGKTGVNFERPAWISLLRECHSGNINCIAIKDLSRLGRNYIETGDYLERILPMLGVRLIAVNDGYDSLCLTNNERLVSGLKNLVNDIYAKDISKKTIAAKRIKQKKGEFIGAYAAYGYLKDPSNLNKIIVNPETAPVVRRIFEMKAEGLGNGTICQKLNGENIPCPHRYRYVKGLTQNNKYESCIWIISTVSEILRNPLYLGHMTQGKVQRALCEGRENKKIKRDDWVIVPNTHEAIVSEELWNRAHTVIEKRAEEYRKNRHKNENEQYHTEEPLLYGAAFCADCGKALARRKINGGAKGKARRAYACRKQLDLHACTKKHILETDLYEAVYQAIRAQVQRYADAKGILEKLNHNNGYELQLMHYDSSIEEAGKELRRLSSLRQAVYEDYTSELLTVSEYQFAIEKYNADINIQRKRLEATMQAKAEYSKNTKQADKWSVIFSQFTNETRLTAEMVHAFIERIEISETDRISITFKFRDEYDALMQAINESVAKAVPLEINCALEAKMADNSTFSDF